MKRLGKLLAKAGLAVTSANVNSVCSYFFYQPKLPKGVEKLRKL